MSILADSHFSVLSALKHFFRILHQLFLEKYEANFSKKVLLIKKFLSFQHSPHIFEFFPISQPVLELHFFLLLLLFYLLLLLTIIIIILLLLILITIIIIILLLLTIIIILFYSPENYFQKLFILQLNFLKIQLLLTLLIIIIILAVII